MNNKKTLLMILVFAYIALSLSIQCVSAFGSAQNKRFVEIVLLNASDIPSVQFKMFFFNIHEDSDMQIKLSVEEFPKHWKVKIEPDEFTLKYFEPERKPELEEGYEYLILPSVDGYVKSRVVTVTITPHPRVMSDGEYDIRLSARGGGSEGTISTSQARDFEFKVIVIRKPKLLETLENITANVTDVSEEPENETKINVEGGEVLYAGDDNFTTEITGAMTLEMLPVPVIVAVVTLIIAIVLLLYKKE